MDGALPDETGIVSCLEFSSFGEFSAHSERVGHRGSISVLYTNARSIKDIMKFEDFKYKIQLIKPHIIVVVETWLNEGDEIYFSLEGFNLCTLSREQRRGGGVAVYVTMDYQYRVVGSFTNVHEILHVEIRTSKEGRLNNIINLLAVYNPKENNIKHCCDELEQIISNCSSNVILIGDFNLNILQQSNSVKMYYDLLDSYGYKILNTVVPTRLGNLIDHVSTNFNYSDSVISVIQDDFSDHNWMHVLLSNVYNTRKEHSINYKFINYRIFREYITAVPLRYSVSDPEGIAKEFIDYCNYYLNLSTSERESGGFRKGSPPWATKEYSKVKRKKETCYKRFKSFPDCDSAARNYRLANNAERNLRRKLIKAYNDRLISKHAKNPRMLWRSIKEVCYVRNVCEQKVDAVRVDGKLVVNEQDIANAMNDYFIKIGPTTQQQARNVGLNLPSVNYTLRGELYEPAEKTLFSTFELVEKKDLVPIVNSLKNNAVSEFDIPAKALKIILEADPVPVVAFVNSILQCGVIPKSLKRSVVTPHFKKGDPLELINYRPISKTSNLLKIPEKIIKTQIMDYLNAKKPPL